MSGLGGIWYDQTARAAGAIGYLTKDAGAAEIQQALRLVANGQAALDPMVQRQLVEALAAGNPAGRPGTRMRTAAGTSRSGSQGCPTA